MIRIFWQRADEVLGQVALAAGGVGLAGALGVGFDPLEFVNDNEIPAVGIARKHAELFAATPLLGEKDAVFLHPLVGGDALLFHIGEPADLFGLAVHDREVGALIFRREPREVTAGGGDGDRGHVGLGEESIQRDERSRRGLKAGD